MNSVIPIETHLKTIQRELDDLEWNGGSTCRRQFLMAEIARVQRRIAQGDQWEVLF